MDLLSELLEERAERNNNTVPTQGNSGGEEEGDTLTCDFLQTRFGQNYVKQLCNFAEAQVTEIEHVCNDTLKPTGPGRRYMDIRCCIIIYLTWLTSGWTISKMASLFKAPRANIQRTLTYVMSGLTESLKAAYLPKSLEEIEFAKPVRKFKFFPHATGAVDATLIPIRKPMDRDTNNAYYSGKHACHGAKIQVVVDPSGKAIHVSSLIPGRRHDSILFRESGVPQFFKIKREKNTKNYAPGHCYLLADSGYIGLDDIYPELVVSRKKLRNGELAQESVEWNPKLHSDRAIVENFFGRMKGYFYILSVPYRGALNALEDLVVTCICLTNLLLKTNPLRSNEEEEDSSTTSCDSDILVIIESSPKRTPKTGK